MEVRMPCNHKSHLGFGAMTHKVGATGEFDYFAYRSHEIHEHFQSEKVSKATAKQLRSFGAPVTRENQVN